ncbi:hypothetical protein GCM10012275_45550 [Longimycelium tulufanense]|uniref:Antitoxin n=1 Tax=Longimycelium tulufanense TaxID=907463 RepID=A0A8J3CHX3_9PSEU|nr:hypothetical protein [Longimycelium tulufanense]GGM69941.1 hypothetical protein GCM10012275_45550 [Longimycelium tulufanense]
MSTRELTVPVPADVHCMAILAAAAAGVPVSDWLVRLIRRAAQEQAALLDGRTAVREFEADYGPMSDGRERGRPRMTSMGVLPVRDHGGDA